MEGDNRFRAAARAHQAGLLDEAEEISHSTEEKVDPELLLRI